MLRPSYPGCHPCAASLRSKSLTTSMDAGNLSANGGLVVLRAVAERLGLAEVIAQPIPDSRNPSYRRS